MPVASRREGAHGRAPIPAFIAYHCAGQRQASPDYRHFRRSRGAVRCGCSDPVIVRKTHLLLLSRDHLKPPRPPADPADIFLLTHPVPQFARFLYTTVGKTCLWSTRLTWPDAQWARHFEDPHHELWLAWRHEGPIGFAELLGQDIDGKCGSEVEIAYLGLLPQFRGEGLGRQLLWAVADAAWEMPGRIPGMAPVCRVRLDTRSLDSPCAVPNYISRGFKIDRTSVIVRPPGWFHARRAFSHVRRAWRESRCALQA